MTVAALTTILQTIEWSAGPLHNTCPMCGGLEPSALNMTGGLLPGHSQYPSPLGDVFGHAESCLIRLAMIEYRIYPQEMP
jgi:hypothetical protein